jgi:hypothetical protein
MPADNPPVIDDECRTVPGGCGGSMGMFNWGIEMIDIDDIFNNARKNMIPKDMWDKIAPFPAYKAYIENHYHVEKVKDQKEVKILKNALDESQIIGEFYYKVSIIFLDIARDQDDKEDYMARLKQLEEDKNRKLKELYDEMGEGIKR